MAKIDQEMEGIRSDKQLDKTLLTQSSIDAVISESYVSVSTILKTFSSLSRKC